MSPRLDMFCRARAASIHLLISLIFAGASAVLVFLVWYPGPFRDLAGGRELFALVTVVDVVLGPLLTFAVFSASKPLKSLRLDLVIIGAIQLVALAYGLRTVYIARPIAMVFEVDRFRLVSANSVATDELPEASTAYRTLPLWGPWLLGTRAAQSSAERLSSVWKALDGVDIGNRPLFWQPYGESRVAALARARPLSVLLAHYPQRAGELRERLRAMGADEATGRFLPVVARGDWVAVLDNSGGVLGYLPLDGFF